ncbi:MAG TPA: IS21 family transposase [Acidimicrobiales bacterium]|nr:IS21 family transposase [Acidimicrobiales bacterium]
MAFREVRVFEVREVVRLWLAGEGLRSIERLVGVERKTVRRYVAAAEAAGVNRGRGDGQLSDEVIGVIVEAVRPHRTDGRGAAWRTLGAHHDQIAAWVKADLTAVKIQELLERQGVLVPLRTVQRYVLEVCGRGRGQGPTVRVADGEPGDELQVDFGRMGLVPDPATGRNRVTYALIFTACYSRHQFVWLTHRQTTEAVIEGFEAAWAFFGGVFRTVIPDNMAAIVDDADAIEPRFNQAFVEYAQARGFMIDPARVRRPKDKPRVERNVPFVRRSMFAGECFIDVAHAQRHAVEWCTTRAGLRVHGTTQARPAEVFAREEQPVLRPTPTERYDLPHYATAKVHRDHHIEVARALYSIPGNLIGRRVEARADRALVRVFHRGQLVKVHPRQPPGGRSTDPEDLPAHKSVYAMRDLTRLQAMAADHGEAIGAYATALLNVPLPWTRMRSVYALLGLVKKWGDARVEAACASALDHEVVNVGLIGRMLERGTENVTVQPALPGTVIPARFARDPAHFAVDAAKRPHPPIDPVPSNASAGLPADGFSADAAGGGR